jgi:hypothetical protein
MFCRLTVSGTTGSQSINGIRIILITQQQEPISGETNSTYTPPSTTVELYILLRYYLIFWRLFSN